MNIAARSRFTSAAEGSVALIVGVTVWFVYWLTAVLSRQLVTPSDAYFNKLAEAFLDGRLDLVAPPSTWDLSRFNGHWYVPFPPLPAILMIPFVAIVGADGVNTTFFCTVAGAISAALLFLVLETMVRRGWLAASRENNLWLTALFAFGTVNWWMSTTGNVWYVAQVTTCAFVALAVLLAVRRAPPICVGTSLALAVLGRPPVAAVAFLIVAVALLEKPTPGGSGRWVLAFAAPILIAVGALAAYNFQRFGSPGDFGYLYSPNLSVDGFVHGQFSLRFLPRNLMTMFLAPPRWNPADGLWTPSRAGMGVLLTTPAFLWTLRAVRPGRLVWGAWSAVGVGLTPALLYYTTGAWQFGSRFTLDATVPLLVLVALGVRDGFTSSFRAASVVSVAAHAIGTAWWHWPR